MKQAAIAVLLAAAVAAAFDPVNLDSIIRSQMVIGSVPGLSCCAIKNGDVVWHGEYGYARLRDSLPVTESTLFYIASMSKSVTAAALMQLWEAGRFGLNDDVSDHLPFTVVNPFYPDDSISPRMLLNHTSSIIDNYAWYDSFLRAGDTAATLREGCEWYLTPGGRWYSQYNFNAVRPGTMYAYGNISLTLAGYLVEAVTGRPDPYFTEHCRDSIFLPLGMNRTVWLLRDCDTNQTAVPYNYTGGRHVPMGYWSWPAYPAACLKTTALELARFLAAFTGFGRLGGTRILDSATVRLMTTVQPPPTDYGLGWMLVDYGGRSLWGHHGGPGMGITCEMWWCEEETSGAVVLTNVQRGDSRSAQMTIADALLDYVHTPGIEERAAGEFRVTSSPTIVRGVLFLPRSLVPSIPSALLDIGGREVMNLQPGGNDVRGLSPGVYFVRSEPSAVGRQKLVVTR